MRRLTRAVVNRYSRGTLVVAVLAVAIGATLLPRGVVVGRIDRVLFFPATLRQYLRLGPDPLAVLVLYGRGSRASCL